MIFVYCEDKGFLFSKQILFQKRLFRALHTTHKYPNQRFRYLPFIFGLKSSIWKYSMGNLHKSFMAVVQFGLA